MKIPTIISLLIFLITLFLTICLSTIGLEVKDYIGLSIGAWATAGGLISATFVVYGYLINLKAFNQSQRPQLLMYVENSQVTLNETGKVVHETRINYRNISSVECELLNMYAYLVSDSGLIEIPNLFNSPFNLQVGDSRVRNIPTYAYFKKNGIDQNVIDNLDNYKLRIGYSFKSLGENIERCYDYEWSSEMSKWNIA